MSVDSGAAAYVQSPGTATPAWVVSISATSHSSSPNPPPTLMGGGELTGERIKRMSQSCHESVSLSVQGEVVAALVRAGAFLAELHEDVVEERGGAEPVELRRQPRRPKRLVDEDEVLNRLLRLANPARGLEADAP